MYDWLGSIRELPLFFSIHRPLATSTISRQEIVQRNEGVFVHDLVSSSMLSINEKKLCVLPTICGVEVAPCLLPKISEVEVTPCQDVALIIQSCFEEHV